MDNIEKRLAEIRARLAAATPGPWDVLKSTGPDEVWEIGPIHSTRDGALDARDADVDFMVHAVDDIPWLIDELNRAMRVTDAYRRAYTELIETIGSCSCPPIWSSRGLHGPHCMWNNTGVSDIAEKLVATLGAIGLSTIHLEQDE